METMNKVTDCDKWVYIDEISKDDVLCANQIHCDTRDFHCLLLSEKVDIRDRRQPMLRKSFITRSIVFIKMTYFLS